MRIAILKWLLPAILATGGWAQEVAANLSVGHNFPAVGVAPGTAKWVEYSPQVAILVFPPPRIVLAAVVRVSTTAPLPAASISLINPFCSVIPTLEVYDTSTNKTTVVLSGPALAPPILPTPRRATSFVPALSQETQE
jgi:hypothetical protein